MALRTAYKALLPSFKNFLPIAQCRPPSSHYRLFHVSSSVMGTTHSIEVQTYPIDPEKFDKLVKDDPIPNIRKITGSVVRLRDKVDDKVDKVDDEVDIEVDKVDDDEDVGQSKELLLVGHGNRLKAVHNHLNAYFADEDPPEKFRFMPADFRLIWQGYRRNFKGQFPPKKPRKKCIRYDRVLGNPCPLCQLKIESDYDPHFTDIEILEQFISPHTWEMLDHTTTGLCKKQQDGVVAAIAKARLHGYMPFTLPLPSDEPRKHEPAGVPTDRKIKYKIN